MIFTLPAQTIYEATGRVSGWKHSPARRQSLRAIRSLVPRLRELKVEKVVCSDLDAQTGELLGRALRVPVEQWDSLRRFNAGKLHGAPQQRWADLMDTMQLMWQEKPDVPVKGGDSQTSFKKRVTASHQRLVKTQQNILVVAPEQVLQALLDTDSKLEPCRLYAGDIRGAAA